MELYGPIGNVMTGLLACWKAAGLTDYWASAFQYESNTNSRRVFNDEWTSVVSRYGRNAGLLARLHT